MSFIPNGNSDSERGFSDLSDIFTKKRNKLTDDVIEALLRAKFMLRNKDCICYNFPVSTEMITGCRTAHQRYVSRMKEEAEELRIKKITDRREVEEAARAKRKLTIEIEEEKRELEEKEKAADSLLKAYQEAIEVIRREKAELLDKVDSIPKKMRPK